MLAAGAALLSFAQPALAAPQRAATGAAAAEAPPRPAIWLVEDKDTKIYLFGTIHILPPGFKWRSAALERVVASADELVVETYEPPGGDIYSEAVQLFLADEPTPILDRVPAEKREALAAAIKAGPLPTAAYDMLQTWAAAMTLGLAKLLEDYGVEDAADAPGVEDVLEDVFRKAGKPIGSVEDPMSVLTAINALPADVQSELLVQTVEAMAAQAQAQEQQPDRINEAWVAGKAERMEVTEADGLPRALHEVLLTKRNAAWTEWLARRLERPGTILFAVGAGHLAGPDSVQLMLEKRGLKARRID